MTTSGPSPVSATEALTKLAHGVQGLTNADFVWIATARPNVNDGRLTPVVALGRGTAGPQPLDLRATPPLVLEALRLAETGPYTIFSPNPAGEARFHGIDRGPIASIMCLPIHEQRRPFVALVAARARLSDFDSHQRELASLYAQQIAITVNLLDAVSMHHAQSRERAALNAAISGLASGMEPVEVIDVIANSINSVVSVDAALIYRFNPREEKLWLVTGIGIDAQSLSGRTISIHDQRSLAAEVASTREPLFNEELARDQSGSLTGVLAHHGPVWLMCEPLVSQDRVLGVLMLARKRLFARFEQRLSREFVAPAAAALVRAELFEEVRAQRDQRNAMFTSASDGMALVGGDCVIEQVNEAFAGYLGVAPDHLAGQTCWQALHEGQGPAAGPETCRLCRGTCQVRACLDANAGIGPIEGAFALREAVGGRPTAPPAGLEDISRSVAFTVTPVAGPEGRQALLVGRDITALRNLELRRKDYLETLAHEIRQPLTAAMLSLEEALGSTSNDLSMDQRKRLEQVAMGFVKQAAVSALDLETVMEREFGLFTVDPRPGDLSAVVYEAAIGFGSTARAFGVRLTVEAPMNLPPALIDGQRVKQVVSNLLFNALKFTPAGGVASVLTRVGSENGRQWAFLIVEDSGPGIAPESQGRIFDRGFQVEAAQLDGRPRGAGMGLAVVRYIMEGHGSERPGVESDVGKGATFIARFPLA